MEDKAHQDDFDVPDVSLAQTLHKGSCYFPWTLLFPTETHFLGCLKQEKIEQETFACRSGFCTHTGFVRTSLSSPTRTETLPLSSLIPDSCAVTAWQKGYSEDLPSNFCKISIFSVAGYAWKMQMKVWRHLMWKIILFEGSCHHEKGLARLLSKGCRSAPVSAARHSHSFPALSKAGPLSNKFRAMLVWGDNRERKRK